LRSIQRLDEPGLDELAEHVHGDADEHVERQPVAQLGDRLVHRVERGHLDLAVALLAEVLQDYCRTRYAASAAA
jgi:hypothetical protein